MSERLYFIYPSLPHALCNKHFILYAIKKNAVYLRSLGQPVDKIYAWFPQSFKRNLKDFCSANFSQLLPTLRLHHICCIIIIAFSLLDASCLMLNIHL